MCSCVCIVELCGSEVLADMGAPETPKSRSAKPLILHLTRLGSVSHACASQSCNAAYANIRTSPGAWGCKFQAPHSIQQVRDLGTHVEIG
jgi:hypothetical protein